MIDRRMRHDQIGIDINTGIPVRGNGPMREQAWN
jgi:hypothetical protein